MDKLIIVQSIFIGIISTAFMDVIAWILRALFKISPMNYAFIGRWFLSWKDRKFSHNTIVQSPSKKGETICGWGIHYLTGVIWTLIYLVLNKFYVFNYSFISVFIFAVLTTFVSFTMIQPALGFGFFAKKMPNQMMSIQNSLVAHIAFGCGLYLSLNLFIHQLT
ncbi:MULTISPECIES: DUF2938 family protein [Acinetobacter]|nr:MULTISPECIES: DUF2938 family protein [Acinetobacter]MBI1452908.1 DUF2938 family protein [Acinetobacter sp. FL51]